MRRIRIAAFLLLVAALPTGAIAANFDQQQQADDDLCSGAVAEQERGTAVPDHLLGAIALVESGRARPDGRVKPWPWTINVGGAGFFFASAEQAISAVTALQATGIKSIDVGCMQINLFYHPHAFQSLQQAFDPQSNTAYAAKFLLQLHDEMRDWSKAAAAYHSRDPDLASRYLERVMAVSPLSRLYAGQAPARRAPRDTVVDPYHVYTPDFAARLRQEPIAREAGERRLAAPELNASGIENSLARRTASDLQLLEQSRIGPQGCTLAGGWRYERRACSNN